MSLDQRTGATCYTVRITVPKEEISRLRGLRLVTGMPVEAFVQTTPRKVLSFLIRPVRDQIERAFREK